jgi:hypothetical protein
MADRKRIAQVGEHLKQVWGLLNYTEFKSPQARRVLVSMLDTTDQPIANYLVTSLRLLHDLSNLSVPVNARDFLNDKHPAVAEFAMHRIAATGSFKDLQGVNLGYSNNPALKDIYRALRTNQYHPNPAWFASVHSFTQDLLKKITCIICAQYPQESPTPQRMLESGLVATAIVNSRNTFNMVYEIIDQIDHDLAEKIKGDQDTFVTHKFAYHFTSGSHLLSIAEKGLGSQFSPSGSEQAEAICFNNAHWAGLENVLLGIEGYYAKEFLLRVPVTEVRATTQRDLGGGELEDLTADYLLDRGKIIPPQIIEIVDPQIATRAIPLLI